MTDEMTPANNNFSFSQIMDDKQRTLTEDALSSTIHLLKEAGIDNSMIAETLFSFLKSSLTPSKNAPPADSMIWYAQLQRFRFDLDTQINIIEAALDDVHE